MTKFETITIEKEKKPLWKPRKAERMPLWKPRKAMRMAMLDY